ncbi:lipoate--protein ligase family protein [Paenibacillus riograndensis]|uniref:lipoate--protein ligase family protein n=1 Tax=Paenibacillus riograndensis TaxID=483937 RepID=UPI000764BF7E|nr:lipoate--protein ligase family protein [Paenibacillus riograndensis]
MNGKYKEKDQCMEQMLEPGLGLMEVQGQLQGQGQMQGQVTAGVLPPVMVLFEHLAELDASPGSGGSGIPGSEAAGALNPAAEPGGDMLLPFAFEETLCRDVGTGLVPPSVHLWSHPGGVALGLRDSKLPRAAEAMAELEGKGYRTAVRHSGGAAVPLDAGVVNVSLLLHKSPGKLDFHDDFRLLASLITEAVAVSHPQAAAQIQAGEVAGSYCPGDFDLAIGGRKFCGIAQRRQSSAYFVHAFVIVSGSGLERGQLIRGFYDTAADGNDALAYPRVIPQTLAALGELGGPASAAVFAEGFRLALARRGVHLQSAGQLRQTAGYSLQYADPRVLEAAKVLRERYAR